MASVCNERHAFLELLLSIMETRDVNLLEQWRRFENSRDSTVNEIQKILSHVIVIEDEATGEITLLPNVGVVETAALVQRAVKFLESHSDYKGLCIADCQRVYWFTILSLIFTLVSLVLLSLEVSKCLAAAFSLAGIMFYVILHGKLCKCIHKNAKIIETLINDPNWPFEEAKGG